ncbi:MAG TPA: hypothetical protein DDW49_08030 [Deltaproteobacteria bacterium]|nr:MAG: hypothetical protein A2048_02190 [Deltaproteobacteria bacterium GWA2_45_12]HBF13312.1 hypothetical protein [Deltaproteobacteria bacterium]
MTPTNPAPKILPTGFSFVLAQNTQNILKSVVDTLRNWWGTRPPQVCIPQLEPSHTSNTAGSRPVQQEHRIGEGLFMEEWQDSTPVPPEKQLLNILQAFSESGFGKKDIPLITGHTYQWDSNFSDDHFFSVTFQHPHTCKTFTLKWTLNQNELNGLSSAENLVVLEKSDGNFTPVFITQQFEHLRSLGQYIYKQNIMPKIKS